MATGRRRLLAPGPTPVPSDVLAATAQEIVHHRGPDFRPLYGRCLERLAVVCRTSQEPLLLTCSGTGAFESAVQNLVRPGERVVSVSCGAFGEKWTAMARRFGAEVREIRYEWGEVPSAGDLASVLAEWGGAGIVQLVHSETSTGVVSDVEAFAEACREAGALVVVDAVSSLGAVPVETDRWGLDVVVAGSQKALMCPPGLAVAAVSGRAYEQADANPAPRFYLDWDRHRRAQESRSPAFTPAVSLVAGLDVALGRILEEGLEQVFERHVRLGRACRAGAKAMGLSLFSPDDDSSAVVTTIRAPEGVDASEVTRILRERFGITIAGGHGPLKPICFRVGHIGHVDLFDIATALAAVELALAELGAPVEHGAAVEAATAAYDTPVTA